MFDKAFEFNSTQRYPHGCRCSFFSCRNPCHPLQIIKPKLGALQVAAYLEERVNVGVNFVLSAEIDHCRKDYKFGFGMTVGE